jgi:abhydrolase domain-containing protein 17
MGSFISTLVFQPPAITYKRAKKIIWLKSKDGVEIPAIYIDKKSNTTILFSHGNAEDLGMVYEWLVTIAYELRVQHT